MLVRVMTYQLGDINFIEVFVRMPDKTKSYLHFNCFGMRRIHKSYDGKHVTGKCSNTLLTKLFMKLISDSRPKCHRYDDGNQSIDKTVG